MVENFIDCLRTNEIADVAKRDQEGYQIPDEQDGTSLYYVPNHRYGEQTLYSLVAYKTQSIDLTDLLQQIRDVCRNILSRMFGIMI